MYSGNTPLGNKRYLVLLDNNKILEGLQALGQRTDIADSMKVASTADTKGGFLEQEQIDQSDIVILDRLGVALVNQPLELSQGQSLISASNDSNVPILAVVEEETWHAFEEKPILPEFDSEETTNISRQYLEGYRDAVNSLIDKLISPQTTETQIEAAITNESSNTWGLQATKVIESPYSGRGIRVAVLDTGIDLNHPDFIGRTIVSKSFIRGVPTAQDGNGHGTHCIGTACGLRSPKILPRYGIAYESEIYAGKVLSDGGSGSSFDIVDAINWAVVNNCAVISMSLGSEVRRGQRYENFYEVVGDRALNQGSLIVAAAGNESNRPNVITPVGSPANCPSFMAVAALDRRLRVAYFSNAGINPNGGDVNIAGPGVDIYSSYPIALERTGYDRLSGTSMATPHVAGIAALYAQATGQRGRALWQVLTSHARRLTLPSRDVGAGLVIAPTR